MTNTLSTREAHTTAGSGRPELLGELLAFERVVANVSIEHMSERCGVEIAELEDLECGDQECSAVELSDLIDAYLDELGIEPLTNVALEVDLDGLVISIAESRRSSSSIAPADKNLIRYLELVHRAAGSSPGGAVAISSVDLSLLRSALALRHDGVEQHMEQHTGAHTPWYARRWAIAAVLVVLGGAIAVSTGPWLREDARQATEDGGATTTPAGEGVEGAPGVAPQPRIGTAVVVERGPDGVVTSRIPGSADD